MAQAYWQSGRTAEATFSLFIRSFPPNRAYWVCAGLQDALRDIEGLGFADDDIAALRDMGRFAPGFLDYLRALEFTGSARAMPEGSVFFADEPVLEVTAPIIEAQLLETILINRINLQTILATKASRVVHAANGRTVVDFAARRAQGTEAADRLARASYIAGYAGTSNVAAGIRYGIPTVGTMAHSFVMCFESEYEAFRAYAASFPGSSTFLVDTYDTVEGVRAAIAVAGEMREAGQALRAIRIDSGDFAALAAQARTMLDGAGLREVEIFVSGGLDEFEVDSLVRSGAPIDGFGVGTKAGVSADAPWTDCAYKLVEYDGTPLLKLSTGKTSLPGRKQVYRSGTTRDASSGTRLPWTKSRRPMGPRRFSKRSSAVAGSSRRPRPCPTYARGLPGSSPLSLLPIRHSSRRPGTRCESATGSTPSEPGSPVRSIKRSHRPHRISIERK